MNNDFASARVFTDLQGMAKLKLAAKNNDAASLRETAQQFESLFMQMMLKSMRQANITSDLFSSDQMQFHQEMFDNQIALDLASKQSLGIADILVRQLGGHGQVQKDDEVFSELPQNSTRVDAPRDVPAVNENHRDPISFDSPEEFIDYMRPLAENVAEKLGVNADVLVAQSALETGWGKKIIQHSDGGSTHNLFGIKAHRDWQGPSARVNTLEFIDGTMQKTSASFRSYDSFAESFEDYASFLLSNPRYSNAVNAGFDSSEFITALQSAGYATDPRYAGKVINIMDRYSI